MYLYVLKSLNSERWYVGVTTNLEDRLNRHNQRRVPVTAKYSPYRLAYFETFNDLVSARKRERFLKTGDGRRVVKLKIGNKSDGGLINIGPPQSAAGLQKALSRP